MTTTSLVSEVAASARANNESGSLRDFLTEEVVTTILCEGKPVTVWEVAARLGDDYTGQAAAILDKLAADGVLSRFRFGFNEYYAPPEVALTREELITARTLISNSLKGLLLSCRYKLKMKLGGVRGIPRSNGDWIKPGRER